MRAKENEVECEKARRKEIVMEAVSTSETSTNIYQTTRRNIPEYKGRQEKQREQNETDERERQTVKEMKNEE
jgi:hypothetical protein